MLNGRSVYHITRAEPEAGRAAAEEMLRLAIAQETAAEGRAHCTLGYALFKLGRPAQARGHLERSLALFDAARHRALGADYSDDTRVSGLSWLANTLLVLGFPDQALARSREALAEARGLRPVSLALALAVGGCWIGCLAGDPPGLGGHAEELVALSTGEEIPFYLTLGRLFRSWALAGAEGGGAAEDGIALMQEALAASAPPGPEPACRTTLASWRKRTGGRAGPDAGWICSARGRRWWSPQASAGAMRNCTGSGANCCWRRAPRNALVEAEACLCRAVTVARDQGSRWWELRAATSLARLRRGQGRLAEARDLLAPVYASFTEGIAFPDLLEARALLEELGAAPAHGGGRGQEEIRTPRGPDRLREAVPGR